MREKASGLNLGTKRNQRSASASCDDTLSLFVRCFGRSLVRLDVIAVLHALVDAVQLDEYPGGDHGDEEDGHQRLRLSLLDDRLEEHPDRESSLTSLSPERVRE